MKCRLITCYCALMTSILMATHSYASSLDVITDAKITAASSALEYSLRKYQEETATVSMYSPSQMHEYIEQGVQLSVVSEKDRCQFTPDIEARARIVAIPVFEFLWGDMLINGTCVQKDTKLGLEYLNKAVSHAYAPAFERLARYYEKGFLVGKDISKSESYMRASAALGSVNGKLGWADMLVRGYGAPNMYEQAYSWLYHTTFADEYRKNKSEYLKDKLEQKMPPNVIARAASMVPIFSE